MAKTKKEKVIDLKAEKISEEQLQKVRETVGQINKTQIEIGANEVRKHELLHNVAGFREILANLQDEFEKQYGTYDVNIHDGTINYPKENGEADKKD